MIGFMDREIQMGECMEGLIKGWTYVSGLTDGWINEWINRWVNR